LHPPTGHEAVPLPPTDVGQLAAHVPATQQPPLHADVPEQDVLHMPVATLHALPDGQLLAVVHVVMHAPFLQTLPEPHACVAPQPPQLLLSVMKLTQAPLHEENPELHVNEQALPEQVGWPLATDGQAWPHMPQLVPLVVVSTHAVPHMAGAVDGQVDTHPYDPAEVAQRGELPLQTFPQEPQLSVPVMSTHPASHAKNPAAHPPASLDASAASPGAMGPSPPDATSSAFASDP
jgi:hypothetical protein